MHSCLHSPISPRVFLGMQATLGGRGPFFLNFSPKNGVGPVGLKVYGRIRSFPPRFGVARGGSSCAAGAATKGTLTSEVKRMKRQNSPWADLIRDLDVSAMTSRLYDPVEKIFQVRRTFLEGCVEGIFREIEERKELEQDHLRRIAEQSCEVRTRVFTVEFYHPIGSREAERIRVSAERDILRLEEQKRMEETASCSARRESTPPGTAGHPRGTERRES